MTYIPRVGNHGLMVEFKSEEAACLEWEHTEPEKLPSYQRRIREDHRPDKNGTCLCNPYNHCVPPGFSTQDGPYTAQADQEIDAIVNMWGRNVSLDQRLEWYDESAEEEREDNEPIWVD